MYCESLSEIHPIECSEYSTKDLTSSLSVCEYIHVRGSETFRSHNVIRLMLLGNRGCGKSSFIQFTSGNKNRTSPGNRTVRSKVKGVHRLFDMIEAPGFQTGAGERVWHEIVSHTNQLGGVDVFLLLLNAMEEDATRVYKELEFFERKYVSNKQLFWERSIVVFTHADSRGSTRSEQEKNIQIMLHNFNADMLRQIVINADNRCLYVNSLDHTCQTVQLQLLNNQIDKIQKSYCEEILLQSVVSMNDYTTMTTFGTSLSHHLDHMNNEFAEFQTIIKKKKKKKKLLNLSRIKEITKLRRGSKEIDEEYKNSSRRSSSLKFVINPLKRILTHNRHSPRNFDRAHSEQSVQQTTSSAYGCEVSDHLNRSSTLPDLFTPEKDESIIKENPHAIAAFEHNVDSLILHKNSLPSIQHSIISEQLIFTVVSDGSDSGEEEFYTPPQSGSEL